MQKLCLPEMSINFTLQKRILQYVTKFYFICLFALFPHCFLINAPKTYNFRKEAFITDKFWQEIVGHFGLK